MKVNTFWILAILSFVAFNCTNSRQNEVLVHKSKDCTFTDISFSRKVIDLGKLPNDTVVDVS